ncbi:hypothetical protein DXG01_014607 [Tephrocybe rancida]|nr:hypothetical protein DXG01_014607 [Tephrocybe rancida]
MAAPTQQYPPWLTAVPNVIFDSNGVPIATETSILFLPLTYYGPSIPLDADWTYGGLTSPAETSTIIPVTTATEPSSTTTNIPITTSTAIPTSPPTSTILTPTATPTTISPSSVSLSNSFTTSVSSASSTPTSVGAASNQLSRGQLIGVIVASILGFIFLFIAALLLYLCIKGRQQRSRGHSFETISPIGQTQTLPQPSGSDGSYQFIERSEVPWDDRVPRPTGGETDPFLAQTTPDSPTNSVDHGMTHRNAPPGIGITRVPAPTTGTQSSKGSSGTSKSSNTNHSGYGVIMERPTLNLLPSTAEELDRQRRGPILSSEELNRINEESVLPRNDEGEYSPLSPPRLLPDEGWSSGNRHSGEQLPLAKEGSQNSLSAYPDANEAATLLTARRVRVETLGSRSPPRLDIPLGEDYSKNGGRSLFSSLGLDRLSWFKSSDSGSRRNSRANSYITSPRNDEDVEMGRALLGPEMTEVQAPLHGGLGLFDGERPISTVSARSAGTVYHDAYSSPGTPLSARTPITPLPRALTPSGSSQQQSGWPSSSPVPPVPDLPNTTRSYSTSITNVNHGLPVGDDILDTPAPTAVSPFATSTATSLSSLRDTVTDITQDLEANPFPPGLAAVLQKSWTDEGSTFTHVTPPANLPTNAPVNVNPFSILSTQETAVGISIDLLEEAPPSAREGWRSLAAEQGFLGGGRRTTFGIPLPSPDLMSEDGYSSRSRLAPSHTRSTGSDPLSARRDLSGSVSSASSRPSAFSAAARTYSSGQSLAHSGSISSDARNRASPAMSAFGPRSRARSPQSPMPNTPPIAHYPPERAGTHRLTGSQDMDGDRSGMSSPEPMSPLSQLSSAPWAGGLGDNWNPTA